MRAHLSDYIRVKCGRADLSFVESIGRSSGVPCLHRARVPLQQNTAWIYMIALKHVLMLARTQGYLHGDPSGLPGCASKAVLRSLPYDTSCADDPARTSRSLRCGSCARLPFGCFTGLSYVDLLALTPPQSAARRAPSVIIPTPQDGCEVHVRLFASRRDPRAYLSEAEERRIFALPSNGGATCCCFRLASMAAAQAITFHSARHTSHDPDARAG